MALVEVPPAFRLHNGFASLAMQGHFIAPPLLFFLSFFGNKALATIFEMDVPRNVRMKIIELTLLLLNTMLPFKMS